VAALAVAALLAPRPAVAQGTPAREAEARKACLTGDYQRGANLLAELFADTGEATYIYNQARCYQQNGRPDEAVNHFREYLRVAKNLPPDVVAETESHIKEMEAMRAANKPATATAPPPTSSPPLPPAPAAATTATSTSPDLTARPEPAESRGRKLRIAGLAVGAVGAVALAGGLVMGLQARALSSDVHTMYDQDKFDRGERASKLQWVGYGLGVAAVGTGAVLFFLGRSADAREREGLALAPLLAPAAGGATLRGSF
jgi:hypothetical protein